MWFQLVIYLLEIKCREESPLSLPSVLSLRDHHVQKLVCEPYFFHLHNPIKHFYWLCWQKSCQKGELYGSRWTTRKKKRKNERREREKQLFHQKCVMKCRSSQNKHHRRAIRRGSRRVANKGETHEQQPFTSLEKLQHHIRAEPRGKSVCKYEVIKTRDSFFLFFLWFLLWWSRDGNAVLKKKNLKHETVATKPQGYGRP